MPAVASGPGHDHCTMAIVAKGKEAPLGQANSGRKDVVDAR
jgi:hypothetical protein